MYVETDFLLALAKRDDWLREQALAVLDREPDLESSQVAFAEFLLVSERFDIDRVRAVANLLDIVDVPADEKQALLKAVRYQSEHGLTTFDAIHAGIAETRDLQICSSDQVFDELDIERVPLEPDD